MYFKTSIKIGIIYTHILVLELCTFLKFSKVKKWFIIVIQAFCRKHFINKEFFKWGKSRILNRIKLN